MLKDIKNKLQEIERNTSRQWSPLIGITFELWMNRINDPDKMPRIIRVENVDPITGMIYIRKVANAPKINDVVTIEPDEFEGWVHPMNILVLTPYTEETE